MVLLGGGLLERAEQTGEHALQVRRELRLAVAERRRGAVLDGEHPLDGVGGVRVHDGLAVGEQREQRREDEIVRLSRQLVAKHGDKLDRVGDEHRVGGRGRLELGEHRRAEEVAQVDEGVGLRRAELRRLRLDREGDHQVDGGAFGLPVGRRRRRLAEQLADVRGEEVGDLRLVVAAERAHEVARDAAARVGVRPLDVATDVLERIVLEELLVLSEQLHVGSDDLLADVLQHLGRGEEPVVDGGGDGGEELDRSGHEVVLVRRQPRLHQKRPDLCEHSLEVWLEGLLLLGHEQREALDDLRLQRAHRRRLGRLVVGDGEGGVLILEKRHEERHPFGEMVLKVLGQLLGAE